MFGMVGSLAARPGMRDQVVGIFRENQQVLESMPGCHLYLVGPAEDDRNALLVVEVWESREAHEASVQIPQVRAVIERTMPTLDVTSLQNRTFLPVAGVGLPSW